MDRKGQERSGKDWYGVAVVDRSGREGKGMDRKGMERNGQERNGWNGLQ